MIVQCFTLRFTHFYIALLTKLCKICVSGWILFFVFLWACSLLHDIEHRCGPWGRVVPGWECLDAGAGINSKMFPWQPRGSYVHSLIQMRFAGDWVYFYGSYMALKTVISVCRIHGEITNRILAVWTEQFFFLRIMRARLCHFFSSSWTFTFYLSPLFSVKYTKVYIYI